MISLLSQCAKFNIPVETNDKAFNILSPQGNCYVIGEFIKSRKKISKGSLIVLVNPSDSGNLGTILRTAIGFGIKNIAIIEPAVDCFDPKTVRASMGSLFHANIEYFKTIESYIDRFPENNLYAFMLDSSHSIHKTTLKEPFSLLFGNEASGLPKKYSDFCESVVIPHSNKIDSLNLSIATSIAIYEFTKNKWI